MAMRDLLLGSNRSIGILVSSLFLGLGKASSDCPCAEWSRLDSNVVEEEDGTLYIAVRPQGRNGPVYKYPSDYGSMVCAKHDEDLPPFCDDRFPPAWCFDEWCYVDPEDCEGAEYVRSKYFPDDEVYYSYGACGRTNSFNQWYDEGGAETLTGLGAMIELVENYTRSNRVAAETSPEGLSCDYTSSCPCPDCSPASVYWPEQKVNFADVSVLAGRDPKRVDDGTCLANAIATTYLNVASKEYDDRTRIGYMYFGHQSSGGYGQWPLTDLVDAGMCTGYDPRFRPWYSSIATGPKDVVLVLDMSGSMHNSRINIAYDAAISVLKTFGSNDYIGVVLFDHRVETFHPTLVPMTAKNFALIKSYLDEHYDSSENGGTDFQISIRKAFNLLRDSYQQGVSSTCNRAIMFLTDGGAGFDEVDYDYVREMSSDLQVAMLTYAIGGGADETVLQRLACENRGVFYRAPDGADLGAIMSKYFLYFATGSRSCTVRWIEYEDWITQTPLMAGCLPFYSPTETAAVAPLRGVSCVDLNMVVPLERMKQHAMYSEFACQTDFSSRQCAALYLRDCDLAAMRAEEGSTCPSDRTCTDSDGYCIDPKCKDNPSFRDSRGYYCDQWVGEHCQQATTLGYSQEDQEKILLNCPHSCLQCARATSTSDCADECTGVSGNVQCRSASLVATRSTQLSTQHPSSQLSTQMRNQGRVSVIAIASTW
jgi:uncharacterized protein YegL